MSIIATASKQQRLTAIIAYQYYRRNGHTPESAWAIARTLITGVIKA